MGSMEEHLGGNTMSIASSPYHLRDLWRSPRGTVLRIEALAMVAIIFSFFLVLFGSCRRWSKHWIVQKGFLAAHVLSLSLGTYSIGLMQSSPVKSKMYPVWVVSLLTLFGCIDPVSTYIGRDYKGTVSKMIFQLCLYFGYVMLMSVSIISSDIGKRVVLLSIITLSNGIHRALAFVPLEPSDDERPDYRVGVVEPSLLAGRHDEYMLFPYKQHGVKFEILDKDVCIGFLFSHQLRQRFFGLDDAREMKEKLKSFEKLVHDGQLTVSDYEQALKVVEVELAFLFEAFFTSNEFLFFDQAYGSSCGALASLVGICYVGVMASSINSAATATGGAGAATSVVVGTTTADLIITLVILVSLALLQVVQLIRCLTSNWARVSIAHGYSTMIENKITQWSMVLRKFLVARVNWFDKYLWQAMLGQDTLPELLKRETTPTTIRGILCMPILCCICIVPYGFFRFLKLVKMLFFGDHTSPGGDVKLHKDVKASIAEFLGTIKSRRIGVEWLALFDKNGLRDCMEYLPYTNTSGDEPDACEFTRRVMIWHVATCYCEEAEKAAGGNRGGGEDGSSREKNRRVAMDLSKYCFYLVVHAQELLPGPPVQTDKALKEAVWKMFRHAEIWRGKPTLEMMQQATSAVTTGNDAPDADFVKGVHLGMRLRNEVVTPPEGPGGRDEQQGEQRTWRRCSSDHWELLARLWVQTLLYAAPYGNVQAHLQRLAQGGEFITHLWALLFHLGIDKWEGAGIEELKAAAAAETTTEVQVQAPRHGQVGCCRHRRAKSWSSSSGVEIEETN